MKIILPNLFLGLFLLSICNSCTELNDRAKMDIEADDQTVLHDSPKKAEPLVYNKKKASILENETKVITEPYGIKLQIEQSKNGDFSLVVGMELKEGSYFGSPHSNNNFSGLFGISIEKNDYLIMDETIVESPKSIAEFDPFEKVSVNWVKENTTYIKNLKILSENDFEVSGLVRFVIEPRCTLEEIEFIISYNSGEMTIRRK